MTTADVIFFTVFCGVCIAGIVFTLRQAAKTDRIAKVKRAEKAAADAKEAKKAAARAAYSGGSSSEGRTYWATGTYDPARYGQFHRSHTAREREYIKDNYGDLNTYESNSPY